MLAPDILIRNNHLTVTAGCQGLCLKSGKRCTARAAVSHVSVPRLPFQIVQLQALVPSFQERPNLVRASVQSTDHQACELQEGRLIF